MSNKRESFIILTTGITLKKIFIFFCIWVNLYRLSTGAVTVNDVIYKEALEGNTYKVREMMMTTENIKKIGSFQDSYLHLAAVQGHLNAVRTLTHGGAFLEARNSLGETPLFSAVKNGNINTIKLLLELGSDVNRRTSKGNTCLHESVTQNNFDIVKLLVSAGANIDSYDFKQQTPLYIAVKIGNTPIFNYLMEHNAGMGNVKSLSVGNSMLYVAAKQCDEQAMTSIISRGFPIDSINSEGRSLIYFTVKNCRIEAIKLLKDKGAKIDDLLHSFVRSGNVKAVEKLILLGENVNLMDEELKTPLHRAAECKNLDLMKLLIENGANFSTYINRQNETKIKNLSSINDASTLYNFAKNNNLPGMKYVIKNGGKLARLLHKAAKEGELTALKNLIFAGADLNEVDELKKTPVLIAAENNQFNSLKLLIEKGANAKSLFINKKTSLHTVQALIRFGIDTSAKDSEGKSILYRAAEAEDLLVVKTLINFVSNITGVFHLASSLGDLIAIKTLLLVKPSLINEKDQRGEMGLNKAAHNGYYSAVKLLLDNGANLRESLEAAMRTNDQVTFERLISFYEDLNALDKDGRSLLFLAANSSQYFMVNLLIHKGANISNIFHKAATEGNNNVIETLLVCGVDINSIDGEGKTAFIRAAEVNKVDTMKMLVKRGATINNVLHSAISEGNINMVKSLLSSGIQFSVLNDKGLSLVAQAAKAGLIEIIKLLITDGRHMEFGNKMGELDLHRAIQQRDIVAVKSLLSASGRNISNLSVAGNKTPLFWAAFFGFPSISEAIINYGGNVNIPDKDGWTPLHIAIIGGHLDVIKLLLDKGATFQLTNEGYTPLDIAVKFNKIDVVRLLIDRGANVNHKTLKTQGSSALHLAKVAGYRNIVDLLKLKGAV